MNFSFRNAYVQMYNVLNKIVLLLKSESSMFDFLTQYAPYKPGSKGTLAERAKALNLEHVANACIYNSLDVDIKTYIKNDVKGKQNMNTKINSDHSYTIFILSYNFQVATNEGS